MPLINCGDPSIDARLETLLREGVAFSLFSLAFRARVEFRGEVSHAPRGAGVSFTGPARLTAPFDLEAAIDLWVDAAGNYELRFALPAVAAMFDAHVRPRLAPPQRARFDQLVRPYQLALAGAAVKVGGAGCSFARVVELDAVSPTRELCGSFPAAGLASRGLPLELVCPPGPGFEFAITGGVEVDAALDPAVTLERVSVSVVPDSRDLFVGAGCRFALRVGGEALVCTGGLEPGGGGATLRGAPAGELWARPFACEGLTLVGLRLRIGAGQAGLKVGLEGVARLDERVFDAELALAYEVADPSRAVLRVITRTGLELGGLLSALIDPSHVPGAVAGLRLGDMVLHCTRTGGSMAGTTYAPGVTIGGQLELWGLRAAVEGQFTASGGGLLNGAMSPVRLPADLPLVALGGAGEAGPSVRIACTPDRQSAEVDVALKIVGRYNHGATVVIERERLYMALARTRLGVYTGGSFELARGRGTLRCEANFDADMKVALGRTALRLKLAVQAAIEASADAQRFDQRVRFDFDACGERLRLDQRVEVRFDEVESVLAHFIRQDRAVAELLGRSLLSASSAAIAWLRGYIDDALQVAVVLHDVGAVCDAAAAGLREAFGLVAEASARALRGATYAPAAVAGALASTYGLGAEQVGALLHAVGASPSEVAAAMRGAFDWSAKKTARFLDDTLKVGDKAAKKALEAAGYSASQVKGAMEDVYGWSESVWESFVDLF